MTDSSPGSSRPATLDAREARVLGVLIEKELTTPDQYPLSLNALTTGCNQKSNREPRTDYTETEVRGAFEALRMKKLTGGVSGTGRIQRFRHNAREALGVGERGSAILAELLLRGAQSPGDLRSRAQRMAPLPTLADLDAELDALLARGYVARLAPLPGTRAGRYDQLLADRTPGLAPRRVADSTAPAPPSAASEPATTPPHPAPLRAPGAAVDPPRAEPPTELAARDERRPLEERVLRLESEVTRLASALERLAASLGETLDDRGSD